MTLEGPEISIDVCGSKNQFVISLTDPDASRDSLKWSEMCHWVAAGLSASRGLGLTTGECSAKTLTTLDETMPYKPGDREHWVYGEKRHLALTLCAP